MTVPAKLAPPEPFFNLPSQPALDQAIGDKTTLFSAPAGYLFTSRLAGILAARSARTIWLRAGPEDRDPATLLLGLINGAEEHLPGVGARTLSTLRHQPGGIYGWAPLYACLARDLAEWVENAQPRAPLALVIQHVEALAGAPRTLALLVDHFLPLLPRDTIRVLASHTALARGSLPGYLQQFSARDLRIDAYSAQWMVEHAWDSDPNGAAPGLTPRSLRRILALTDGRGVALESVLAAQQSLGSETVRRAADISDSGEHLLARLMRAYLAGCPEPTLNLLGLAMRLDYLHLGLLQHLLGAVPELPDGWLFQPLAEGWMRLRCLWRDPLRQSLRPEQAQNRDLLNRAAHFLIQQNAYEMGIPLLLDLDYPQEAARVLVQVVEPLMDLGQWETLSGWLARLPEPVRRDWPWLVYAEGELAAAHGQTRAAGRIFSTSTQLFYEHRDFKGACQSLLTQATLAAWEEEPERAQQFSQQAQALAGSAGLGWYQAWAGWLSGRLASGQGHVEEALSQFTRAAFAAAAVKDPRIIDYIEQARLLAQAQLDLRQQKDLHLQALEEARKAEEDISARLRFLLANPANQSGDLLHLYGWSQVPMFLKLPQPAPPQSSPDRLISMLLARLRPHVPGSPDNQTASPPMPALDPFSGPGLPAGLPQAEDSSNAAPPPATPAAPTSGSTPPAIPTFADLMPVTGDYPTPDAPAPTASAPAAQATTDPASASLASAVPARPEPQPPAPRTAGEGPAARGTAYVEEPITGPLANSGKPALNAYMLGAFRVIHNGAAVESWPSGRARSVFAYLLAQRGRKVPREVIMQTFWPDASPESARNSLNVAVYNLRQTLKTAFGKPLVQFRDDAYQISPEVALWLDFDSFERHVSAGRKEEASGRPAIAIRQYELAISLYQGDLLVENLYEDWPVVEREHLRVLFMETLERLSLIYYDQAQYSASAALCQRMLQHDSCREDAHCRLMRCYSRQGQNHLALRQYQACVEALRGELDVSPSPATVKLYEQIRRRESV